MKFSFPLGKGADDKKCKCHVHVKVIWLLEVSITRSKRFLLKLTRHLTQYGLCVLMSEAQVWTDGF